MGRIGLPGGSKADPNDPVLKAAFVTPVGSSASPITNPATPRPTGAGIVYWLCAKGVTPTNALSGDLIWNSAT